MVKISDDEESGVMSTPRNTPWERSSITHDFFDSSFDDLSGTLQKEDSSNTQALISSERKKHYEEVEVLKREIVSLKREVSNLECLLTRNEAELNKLSSKLDCAESFFAKFNSASLKLDEIFNQKNLDLTG